MGELYPGKGPKLDEPPEEDREYFREGGPHGDLGYKVFLHGDPVIRLDRANIKLRPWNNGQGWWPADRHPPLSSSQMARCAFELDKVLCLYLGMHRESQKEWASLKPGARKSWVEEGPDSPAIRNRVWSDVMEILHNRVGS